MKIAGLPNLNFQISLGIIRTEIYVNRSRTEKPRIISTLSGLQAMLLFPTKRMLDPDDSLATLGPGQAEDYVGIF